MRANRDEKEEEEDREEEEREEGKREERGVRPPTLVRLLSTIGATGVICEGLASRMTHTQYSIPALRCLTVVP